MAFAENFGKVMEIIEWAVGGEPTRTVFKPVLTTMPIFQSVFGEVGVESSHFSSTFKLLILTYFASILIDWKEQSASSAKLSSIFNAR